MNVKTWNIFLFKQIMICCGCHHLSGGYRSDVKWDFNDIKYYVNFWNWLYKTKIFTSCSGGFWSSCCGCRCCGGCCDVLTFTSRIIWWWIGNWVVREGWWFVSWFRWWISIFNCVFLLICWWCYREKFEGIERFWWLWCVFSLWFALLVQQMF